MRKMSSLLAAAALGTMAMAVGPGAVINGGSTAQASPTSEARADQAKRHSEVRTRDVERSILNAFGRGGYRHSYPRGGWSVAHGKRMARKAKNKARNRSAHRG